MNVEPRRRIDRQAGLTALSASSMDLTKQMKEYKKKDKSFIKATPDVNGARVPAMNHPDLDQYLSSWAGSWTSSQHYFVANL